MIKLGIEEIEKVFYVTFKLLFQPFKCFDKNGRLTCERMSSLQYWLFSTFFAVMVLLFALSVHYKTIEIPSYAIVLQFLSSIFSIFLVYVCAYIAAVIYRLKKAAYASDIFLFNAALFTLILIMPVSISLYINGLGSYDIEKYWLSVSIIFPLLLAFVYLLIWVKEIYSISIFVSALFVIFVYLLVYGGKHYLLAPFFEIINDMTKLSIK